MRCCLSEASALLHHAVLHCIVAAKSSKNLLFKIGKSRCPVVGHVDRLTAPLQASRYLSGVSGRGIASPVARMGKGKGYNRVHAANAMSGQNRAFGLFRLNFEKVKKYFEFYSQPELSSEDIQCYRHCDPSFSSLSVRRRLQGTLTFSFTSKIQLSTEIDVSFSCAASVSGASYILFILQLCTIIYICSSSVNYYSCHEAGVKFTKS